jgi:hypothetical protein
LPRNIIATVEASVTGSGETGETGERPNGAGRKVER